MHGAHDCALQETEVAGVNAALMPAVGSAQWIKQLQRIRGAPRQVQRDITLIHGFLPAASAPQQILQQHTNTLQTVPDAFLARHMSETPYWKDKDQNSFQEFEDISLHRRPQEN
jgi:hypothetical protein